MLATTSRLSHLLIIAATICGTLFTVTGAQAKAPRSIVFAYECEQIDPKITFFECNFENSELVLTHTIAHKDLPESKKKRADYEFNKIILRYVNLGGQNFTIRHKAYPREETTCFPIKNGRSYSCL